MALFARLTKKVIGGRSKSRTEFDDLEKVDSFQHSNDEEDDGDDDESVSDEEVSVRDKTNIFVFNRGNSHKVPKCLPSQNEDELFHIYKENKTFSTVLPSTSEGGLQKVSQAKRSLPLQNTSNKMTTSSKGKEWKTNPSNSAATVAAAAAAAGAVAAAEAAAATTLILKKEQAIPVHSSESSKDSRFLTSRSVSVSNLSAVEASSAPVPMRPPLTRQPSEPTPRQQHEHTPSMPDFLSPSGISISANSHYSEVTYDHADDAAAGDEEDVPMDMAEADRVEEVFSKVRHNHTAVVLEALHQGFDVNIKDTNGNTMLHVCAQNNLRKLAATLVQHYPHCAMNVENKKGFTPLDFADKYGFFKMSQWLISYGAVHGSQPSQFVSKMR